MSNPAALGNVVDSFLLGTTRVKFCDDYCRDRTAEEVQQILNRIANRALDEFAAAAQRERIVLNQKDKPPRPT